MVSGSGTLGHGSGEARFKLEPAAACTLLDLRGQRRDRRARRRGRPAGAARRLQASGGQVHQGRAQRAGGRRHHPAGGGQDDVRPPPSSLSAAARPGSPPRWRPPRRRARRGRLPDHPDRKAPQGAHGGNTRWSPSYMRMAAPDRVAPGFEDDLRGGLGRAHGRAYVRRLAAEAPATIAWLRRPRHRLRAAGLLPERRPAAHPARRRRRTVLRELERAALRGRRHSLRVHAPTAAGRPGRRRRGGGAAHGRRPRRDDRGRRRRARDRRLCRQRRDAGPASGPRRGKPEAHLARHLLQYGRGHPHGAGGRSARRWRLGGMHAEPVDPRSKGSGAGGSGLSLRHRRRPDGPALLRRGRGPRARDLGGSPAPSISPRPGASPTPSSMPASATSPATSARSARRCRPIRPRRSPSWRR